MQTASENKAAAICKSTESHSLPVETCWSPLTPEHGFPSLQIRFRALPLNRAPRRRSAVFFPSASPFFFKRKNQDRMDSPEKVKRQKDRDMLPTVALSTSGIRVKALPFLSLSAPLICVIWYALNYTSKKIIVNHCNYLKLVYSSDVKIDIGELTGQWAERGLRPSRPGYLIWIMPT